MIRLSPFTFAAPNSLPEAVELLSPRHGRTSILAGGTNLIVGIKQGVNRPERLVWLGKVAELQTVRFTDGEGLRLGAMCRLADLEQNAVVRKSFPSLSAVIRSIASPQIRNRATIGGNLCLATRCSYVDQSESWRTSLGYCLKHGGGICHAAPGLDTCSAVLSSDLAPMLIALEASVRLSGPDHERDMALKDFYVDDGAYHVALRPGELLTDIMIPARSMKVRTVFEKLRLRGSIDYPLANVATAAVLDPVGVVRSLRMFAGAVMTIPVELAGSEELVLGRPLSLEVINRAAEAAAECVRPVPTSVESVLYRKSMVRQLVKKSLRSLMSSPGMT